MWKIFFHSLIIPPRNSAFKMIRTVTSNNLRLHEGGDKDYRETKSTNDSLENKGKCLDG